MKKDPFDLSKLLDSLNESEYKEKLKKDMLKLEERSIELIRVERGLFPKIQKDFIVKNGFTKMDYGILKLKMHMYHEEKKDFRMKYQKVNTFLSTSDHSKEQFYLMDMYVRKMGRNLQKMKDFHEWVEEMIETKKMEREMKKLSMKKESFYISSPEND